MTLRQYPSFLPATVLASALLLAGCNNQDNASDQLAADALGAYSDFAQTLETGGLEEAEKSVEHLRDRIETVINDDFDGDFCTVPFEGFACAGDGTPQEYPANIKARLERTAARYAALLGALEQARPVTDPVLTEFRPLETDGVRNDVIGVLRSDQGPASAILLAALTRGQQDTCQDLRALGNEFERDAAFERLTARPDLAWSEAELPVKISEVVQAGEYSTNKGAFIPNGKIGKAGRNQTYRLTNKSWTENGVLKVDHDLATPNCDSADAARFAQMLVERGVMDTRQARQAAAFVQPRSKLTVVYMIDNIDAFLFRPIPAEENVAKGLVESFSRIIDKDVREERPMVSIVTARPNGKGGFREIRRYQNPFVIDLDPVHISYYPLTNPVVSDSMFQKDFYVGFPDSQTFPGTDIPSIKPLWQTKL